MHIHFTYVHVSHSPELEKLIQTQVQKLDKLLAHFSPDLVHLRGALESNEVHSNNTSCSLNLALPTAQLHARQEGPHLTADLQACFDHLIEQLKKHKAALRREETWKPHKDASLSSS